MIALEAKINFKPLLLPLKIFSKPSCFFQTWTVSILPPHCRFKGLIKGKALPRCERKMAPSDSINFFSLFMFLFLHNLCVLLLFWVSLVLCFALFNMFLFICFQFCIILFFIKKKKELKNKKKYKNSVCFVYIGTCVPWMAIETKFSKLCISCGLNEHLYAQLSKWALWLIFVMSKVKWFLYLTLVSLI